jgi:hypothetical protein
MIALPITEASFPDKIGPYSKYSSTVCTFVHRWDLAPAIRLCGDREYRRRVAAAGYEYRVREQNDKLLTGSARHFATPDYSTVSIIRGIGGKLSI